jgi:hypothetical protein
MSKTQSMTEFRAQIATLEATVATLQSTVAALQEKQSALPVKQKKGRGKAKAVAEEGAEPSATEPKEAKAPSAWNTLVAETVAQMKAEGWPAWTDLKGVQWPASRRSAVKDKSGAEREAHVYDGNPVATAEGATAIVTDGKEPSQALGGMVRASFLKAQSDPEAEAKARKYHAKLAEKRSASSMGSAEKGEPVADAEDAPVAPAPKKRGPKPMTAEQKAEAKAKREAKKAAAVTAEPEAEAEEFSDVPEAAPAAAPAKPAPAPVQKKKISIAGAPAPAPKAVDLSFFSWTHDGEDYFTNDRGDVVSTEFEWVGRFDGTKIDGSAPEPADLADAKMRQ